MATQYAFSLPKKRSQALFGFILGANLQTLDTTIAAVALAHIQGAMSASLDEITWVLTAYLIGVAVSIPLIGILISRFGQRRVFLTATTGFSVAAIMAGSSDNLTQLVGFRFLQGLFAATFVPVAQSFVFETYPKDDQGPAIGILSIGTMTGTAIGPALGGLISEFLNWSWAFYINVPVGLLSFLIIYFTAPKNHKRYKVGPFNVRGYAALAIGLMTLQFILSRGERMEWLSSSTILVFVLLSLFCFYYFAIDTWTSKNAFIDRRIFLDRNFALGLLLVLFLGAYWIVYLTILSGFLQKLAGYPVLDTGLALMIQGASYALGCYFAGKAFKHFHPPFLIMIGFGGVALANWALSVMTPDFYISDFSFVAMLHGIGLGFIWVPLTLVTFSTIPDRLKAVGTGLFSLQRNFGSSLGASLVVVFLLRETQANYSLFTERVSPFSEWVHQGLFLKILDGNNSLGLQNIKEEFIRQALMVSYAAEFKVLAVILILAVIITAFLRVPNGE